jgi:hypothetical protein
MESDPTSFEEAMRDVHSSKWQEAKEDEMKLINTNDVWDLEEIPNGAKTVGCDGSTRQNMTSKGIWKAIKQHLW